MMILRFKEDLNSKSQNFNDSTDYEIFNGRYIYLSIASLFHPDLHLPQSVRQRNKHDDDHMTLMSYSRLLTEQNQLPI